MPNPAIPHAIPTLESLRPRSSRTHLEKLGMLNMEVTPEPPHGRGWECPTCAQDHDHDRSIVFEDQSIWCPTCLQQWFQMVLIYERPYPAMMDREPVHPRDFIDVGMDPDFVARYEEAERGPDINPPHLRIYCPHPTQSGNPCGEWVGQRNPSRHHQEMGHCPRCGLAVCMRCGMNQVQGNGMHYCPPLDQDARRRTMGDLVEGRDWRFCPRCLTAAWRSDGCSQMS